MKKLKKKKNYFLNKYSKLAAALLIISSIVFCVVLSMLGILPEKYFLVIIGGLLLLILLFVLIAFLKGVNNFNKIIQSFICTILSIALILATIGIEIYKDKIRNIFTNTESVTLYVYTLKDSPINVADDLGNTIMGLSSLTNQTVQQTAFDDLSCYLNKYELGSITTNSYSGLSTIVDALYNHEVDSIMVQSNLIDFIEELDNYKNFESRVKVVYESTHKVTITGSDTNYKIKNITKDPFIFAIGGRDKNGHFDVNMAVTVNPYTKQILIVTIPRDAYSPLDGDYNKMDKLAYTGQLNSTVWYNTLQLYFDYNFNYYAIADFYSIMDVIDVLGGIDVYNPYYFTATSTKGYTYYYPEGDIHLSGGEALAYCRERQSLVNGDLSRNEHQSIVLKALIRKLTSASIVNKADSILETLEGEIKTDFPSDYLYKLVGMQLKDNADWNIKTFNVQADLFYTYSYMIGHEYGPNYAMMDIREDSLKEANSLIKQVLDNDILE